MDADVWSRMMSVIQMWLQHRLYSVISQHSQRCGPNCALGGNTKSHSQTQPGGGVGRGPEAEWEWPGCYLQLSTPEEKRLQAALATQTFRTAPGWARSVNGSLLWAPFKVLSSPCGLTETSSPVPNTGYCLKPLSHNTEPASETSLQRIKAVTHILLYRTYS